MLTIKNIYDCNNINFNVEYLENILVNPNFRLERIISFGHITPSDYWYDQEEDEFVLLLKGNAKILLENDEIIELKEGDYVIIPKHLKHKVIYTDTENKTFWITCYFKND